MAPIRIALLGSGIFAREAHAPALRLLAEDFEVAAIYSRSSEHAAALAATFPGPVALYTDLSELLAREDIEAVCAAALAADCRSYRAVKRALERRTAARAAFARPALAQIAPEIPAIDDYQRFFDFHAKQETHHADDDDGTTEIAARAAPLGHERNP